jgi:hypothetical protein
MVACAPIFRRPRSTSIAVMALKPPFLERPDSKLNDLYSSAKLFGRAAELHHQINMLPSAIGLGFVMAVLEIYVQNDLPPAESGRWIPSIPIIQLSR